MEPVHVAVGVILDAENRILITQRDKSAHQGGLWEFPGGKVEAGESVQQALYRELHEELGIEIGAVSALLEVRHDYGDKRVLLDVWVVRDFTGVAVGREGQPLVWVLPGALRDYEFPEANVAIVDAVFDLDNP